MAQKSFIMYESWSKLLSALPKEKAGELVQAITGFQYGTEYAFTDETIEAVFETMIKPVLEENAKSYEETCQKRATAAKKGGRPKKEQEEEQEEEPKGFEEKPKETNRFSKKPIGFSEKPKETNRFFQKPDSESESDSESDKDKKSEEGGGDAAPPTHTRRKPEPKHRYGAYGRVMLTQAQYDRFRDRHGQETTDAAIKILDEYCQSSGKRYADYNLTLYKWPLEEALKRGGEKVEREPERGAGADSSESPDAWTAEQLEQYRRAYEQSAVS